MPYKDPEYQRAAKREWARAERSAVSPKDALGGRARVTLLPPEFRIRRCEHLVQLLEDQVLAVLADSEVRTTERARTIAFLASTLLRALESRDAIVRIEAIEQRLTLQGGPHE